ncbi:MAG: elongation factor P, partial [Thermotogaceae bacterium]|nr:elongation factor P [Thermotogaceae bacterium]
GSGLIRTKLKDLKTGLVRDMNFNSGEKVEEAGLSFRPAQYLYTDGDHYHFMVLDTYEQYALTEEEVGDARLYLTEGMELNLVFFEDRPISIQLPNVVTLKVVKTEPSFKGDTVSGGGKPALLETGLKITVPYFVQPDEYIRVDTRTGEYVERA